MNKLTLLFATCCMVCVMPVWADVSRDDAAKVAKDASGGRVLSVDRTQREGRPMWRVKVLTPQAEVKVLLIDMATGKSS